MHVFLIRALRALLYSSIAFVPIGASATDAALPPTGNVMDVQSDYAQGVAALESGDLALALEIFERVVLLYPNHAGAWLDLALVHIRLGQLDTAADILNHVEFGFALPRSQQQQIARLRQQLLTPEVNQSSFGPIKAIKSATPWKVDLAAYVGHVKNANAGFSDLTFRLTPIGSDPLLVQLDASQRARSDASQLLRLNAQRLFSSGGQTLDHVFVTAGHRHFVRERVFDQGDVGIGWNRYLAFNQWGAEFGASAKFLERGSQAYGGFYSARLAGTRMVAGCKGSVFFDPEYRDQRQAGVSDARISWVGASVDCGLDPNTYGLRWQVHLRSGVDRPEGARAGGVVDRQEALWGLSAELPIGRLSAYGLFGEYQDRAAYSVEFFGEQRRKVERLLWAVELRRKLYMSQDYDLYVSTHYLNINDKSVIQLFQVRDEQLYAGLIFEFK